MVFKCLFLPSLKRTDKTATTLPSTSTYYTALSNFNSSLKDSSNPTKFAFSEIKAATNNFSPSSKIGEREYGCVYKGVINNPQDSTKTLDVVIKQLSKRNLQLDDRFWGTQFNQLGVAEHPNVVNLVGYSVEDDEWLLVYEYMSNRSVEDHLSTKSEPLLSWTTRLKVAQGTARGLAFLNEEMSFLGIIGDFKSSGVLLDDQWNAKVSGFGLEKMCPPRFTRDFMTTVVGATRYLAPEYIETGDFTLKSDVWSYGVFLYELITGRLPLDTTRPKNEQKLLEWVKPYVDSERIELIVDPRLENSYSLESAQKLSVIAKKCLAIDPKSRPKMSEVRGMVNQLIVEPKMVFTHAKNTTENMKNEGETGSIEIQHKKSTCLSVICCRGQP